MNSNGSDWSERTCIETGTDQVALKGGMTSTRYDAAGKAMEEKYLSEEASGETY